MSSAIRLIFERSGGELVLVSRQRVDMTVPESDPADAEAAHPHFVAEVRDAAGAALHRTAMPNPLAEHREVFSEHGEETVHRVPVDEPEGVFTVVVPDHPEADHLSLLMAGPAGGAPGTGASAGLVATARAPREIARISLRDSDEAEDDPS